MITLSPKCVRGLEKGGIGWYGDTQNASLELVQRFAQIVIHSAQGRLEGCSDCPADCEWSQLAHASIDQVVQLIMPNDMLPDSIHE